MIKDCADVYIDDKIYSYIVDLVSQTRSLEEVALGASPRASLIVSKMAQATAYFNGRSYVIPEDIASVFVPVTAHRIVVRREARLADRRAEDLLYGILKRTAVPSV